MIDMWWIILLLAQDVPKNQAEQARASMQESIEKQKASVQRQIASVKASSPQSAPSVIPVGAEACEPIAQPELAKMIDSASQQHHIDPKLVLEVARKESGFRPCVVSPKGAEGLMQLMPETQATLEVHNPFDPQESISAGAKLLKQLLDRYNGDISLALGAYNAGALRVDQAAGVPEIPETKDYVADILSRLP